MSDKTGVWINGIMGALIIGIDLWLLADHYKVATVSEMSPIDFFGFSVSLSVGLIMYSRIFKT